MNVHHQHLPERAGPYRLGRHVEHDARSMAFAAPLHAAPIRSVEWERHGGPFDQGDLGSCTANAMLGSLMTGPYYRQGRDFVEADCVELYKDATRLDTVPGHYPPDDTGSSGIAAMKAAKRAGYVSGYHHVFSFHGVLQALQKGPGITGTNWYEGMFTAHGPDAIVEPVGELAGGHEYLCYGADVERGLLLFWNSWGSGWGNGGRFAMTFGDYRKLLGERGDYTVAVP